jgi:aspartate aminotransferase-like enzyme
VSPRLERRLHADRRTYTTDLSVAVRDQDEGRFTWTPPVTLIAGLAASIMYLQTTGMETVWEIQRVRADLVRRLLRQRGFNLYGISNARGVVVAEHPASAEIKRRLEREHAMIVAGGQDRLSGRVLRIGTCGWYADGMIDDLFAAIDTILSDTPIAP